VLKRREGDHPRCFNVPIIVPALGILICAAMMVARVMGEDWRAPAIAGGLIVAILALYVFTARGREEKIAAYWEGEEG
jgi:hypothetical protein